MNHYKHILIATDFAEQSHQVAGKAKALAINDQALLSIVHVIDNLPVIDAIYGPIIPLEGDLTETLTHTARQHLAKIANKLEITEKNQWLEVGSSKLEIVRIAEENEVDLIVVGSHGRHGLALLLGSTANSVLHHAKCDVLAVRLQDD